MNPFTRTLLIAVMLLSIPARLLLAQAVDPSGHWEGTIQTPIRGDVVIEIDMARNADGELEGTFSTPAQNLRGLPLSTVAVNARSVRFQVKGAPGERLFDGTLSVDGTWLSGDYTQVGYTMPFSLGRKGDAQMAAPVRSPSVGKELEGTWKGTLGQTSLVLTLTNRPDHTVTGSLFNVKEGLEIPIAAITQEASTVILDVKAVGGSFSGAVHLESAELVGTWREGSATLPLTFRLAKP